MDLFVYLISSDACFHQSASKVKHLSTDDTDSTHGIDLVRVVSFWHRMPVNIGNW
jgi:hypothetical protein